MDGSYATKESCRHALDNLLTQERFMNEYAFRTIKAFLEAALKRLPSEEAVANDKKRKSRKTSR